LKDLYLEKLKNLAFPDHKSTKTKNLKIIWTAKIFIIQINLHNYFKDTYI